MFLKRTFSHKKLIYIYIFTFYMFCEEEKNILWNTDFVIKINVKNKKQIVNDKKMVTNQKVERTKSMNVPKYCDILSVSAFYTKR